MIQKPRGTIDILPEEAAMWQYIENKAREVAKRYGFGEIRFPTFEATELFQRGVGDTTDVVQKEMYTFTDRENRSFTLRPEGTACVARSIIENGKCSDALPLKLYYIINCFRYEKPQAGRSREFYQFGAEMFGTSSPLADANMIAMVNCLLSELGLSNYTLHINSIGCPECRPKHRQALYDYFNARKDEMCDTCRDRLEKNPLRILDCKSPICSEIAKGAPKTIDYLCDDCKKHMDTLEQLLKDAGIKYVIDPHVVRGLDYYTRTVFEFVCDEIGAQSTICGGGRYDGLVKELGGPDMPAIGFAMGITRLILTMKEAGIDIKADNSPLLYIAPLGEKASLFAAAMAEKLRRLGIPAECDIIGRSLKAQMKYSDKKGAKNTLIIGDTEVENGKAQLRRMSDGTQTEIDINDIDTLKELLYKEI